MTCLLVCLQEYNLSDKTIRNLRLKADDCILVIVDVQERLMSSMKEETKITSKFGNDPVALLRARELDLQAQENSRKKQEGEERINLDRMKAMMNKDTQEEKLQQNEKLANLRSDTSIEKTILQNELRKDN